jgi:hypothetical protein
MTDTQIGMRSRITFLPLVASLVLAACALSTWAQESDVEQSRTWQYEALGMTLTLPPGMHAQERAPARTLARFVGPGGEDNYAITLRLKQFELETKDDILSIRQIMEVSFAEVEATWRGRYKVVDGKDGFQVGPYQAGCIYFRIDDLRRPLLLGLRRDALPIVAGPKKPWVFGQVFIQTGLAEFVLLQLDVDAQRFDVVRPIFEDMIQSLRLDMQQRDRQRAELAKQFVAWRPQINTAVLRAACIDDQWFRIVDGKQDVGYMHVQQRPEHRDMGVAGIQVRIESHVTDRVRDTDTLSKFFLSNDGESEVWSVVMTHRPSQPQKGQRSAKPKPLRLALKGKDRNAILPGIELEADATTWVETGIRSGKVIKLTRRRGDGATKEHEWERPDIYLSQVQLHLLGQLGASSPWSKMGFYVYSPSVGKIMFHTEKLERSDDQTYRRVSQPTPDSPPFIMTYDAQGRLQSQIIPGGRRLLPTSRKQIALMWPKPPPDRR